MGSFEVAAQLQISCWEDGMQWLDRCPRICIVGEYCYGTLNGGWMSDNLEFFGDVFGHF